MPSAGDARPAKPALSLYFLVVLFGLAIRLFYVSTCNPANLYTRWSTATDARVYDQFGWNLVSHGILGVGDRPSGFAMPGYPLLLAGIYSMAGHSPGAARWVQALLGVLTVIALGRLARSLSGPLAEILTVTAAAVYPFFVYFTGEILTECLFLCALSGVLFSAFRVGRHGRIADGVFHGVCLAVAAMTRPVGILLEPAVLVLARPWARERRRPRLVGLLLGFLIYGAAWGGWIARNRSVFGETVLFDTHGGFSLYIGQLLAMGTSQEEIASRLGINHDRVAEGRFPGGPRGELDADRRARENVWANVRQDPARFAGIFLANAAKLWIRLDFSEVAGATQNVGLATVVGWVSYLPVLLLGCAGFWVLCRRRCAVPVVAFLGVFLITSAIHALVVGGQRYRVATVDPLLLVLAAVAVSGWIESRDGLRAWVLSRGVSLPPPAHLGK